MPSLNNETLESIQKQTSSEVDLSNFGLFDKDIPALCSAIKKNSNITFLNLGRNNLSSESSILLTEINQIKKLKLYQNNIDDTGIEQLVKNKNLEELDVSHNNISDNGATLIFNSESLKKVNINYNSKISKETQKNIDEKFHPQTNRTSAKFPSWSNRKNKNSEQKSNSLFTIEKSQEKRFEKDRYSNDLLYLIKLINSDKKAIEILTEKPNMLNELSEYLAQNKSLSTAKTP